MIINDREWKFLAEQTGLSLPFNDMYFRYLRSLGFSGTLQDMIGASGLGLAPSKGKINPPDWVKGRNHFDFANDQYWKDNQLVDRTEILSGTGGNPGTVFTTAGNLLSLNAPRITDRGLIIEPAVDQLNQRSNNFGDALWTKEGVTVGTRTDNFTPIMETTANSLHRIFKGSNHDVISGTTYTVYFTFQPVGGLRYGCIRTAWDDGNKNIGFDLNSVTTTWVAVGFTGGVFKVGSTYVVWFTRAATSNGSPNTQIIFSSTAVTSDAAPAAYAGSTSRGILLGNVDIVQGSAIRSSVFRQNATAVAKTADANTVQLSTGETANLTYVFDDDSTQVVTGVAGGPYAISTNLNRPLVKAMYWGSL